jgi:hypothetical protein
MGESSGAWSQWSFDGQGGPTAVIGMFVGIQGDSLKQSEAFLEKCLQASTGGGLNVVSVEDYFSASAA